MAPMTRFHSPGGVPGPEVADYYRRRAEHRIGLIITEGTLIGHPSASHETTVPRMTAGPAEAGWRRVTDAVHVAGGRIAAQLSCPPRLGPRRLWTVVGKCRTRMFCSAPPGHGWGRRRATRAGDDVH